MGRRHRRQQAVRASWLGMSLAVAGCSRAPSVTSASSGEDAGAPELPVHVATSEVVDAASSALRRLAAEAVTDQDFAHRSLYSWTTREQIAELVAGGNLLSRQASPAYGLSELDHELVAILQRGEDDVVARYLRGGREGLTFRRFAWTTAWPTVSPQGPFPYGDQLLRITLKPEAIIARFAPTEGDQRWSFVTATGGDVSRQEVEAHPERLAAIFHVQRAATYRYREFVLCNETMIEEWSTGDGLAKAQLEADADLMRDLAVSPPPDEVYDAAIAFEVLEPSVVPPRDFAGRETKLRAALASQAATLVRRPSLTFDTASSLVVLQRQQPRRRRPS